MGHGRAAPRLRLRALPNDAHSPTDEHPAEGVRILAAKGYPEPMQRAILGHASYSGVPRDTPMAKTLFAVDELRGILVACAGDRDAFGALVLRHQAAVRRVCRAVTLDDHDADDAAQDAFLSALDRIETYDRTRPIGPWLMRIATNAAIDLLRRRNVRRTE